MIEKTINNDLEKIYGQNNSFFTGVEDTLNLYLDPIVSGYAFIYWVDLPKWFTDDNDLKYFRRMSQINFRAFNGITAFDLNTVTTQTGFPGHEVNFAGGISRQNTEFTISHKEYSGSPMTKMYQKWISMIRDPRTGIALYPKLYNVEYGARNHTGQLLYIVTRPDVTAGSDEKNHVVEYAAFYSNVMPTNVPLDTLYQFELGTQDTASIDITFKGFPEIGPNVNLYAEKVLREKILNTEGSEYIPFVDSLNTNTDAANTVAWGNTPLKEIYQEMEASGSENIG